MLSCRVCLSAEHQSVCDARNKARKGSNAPKLQQPLCNILCTPRRLGRPWPLGCGWGSPTKPAELELGLWHDGFVESSLCSLDHSLDHARCSQGLQPLPSQPASLPRRYSRPHVSRRGDLVWPRHDGCVHPQLGPSRTLDHGGSCFARGRDNFSATVSDCQSHAAQPPHTHSLSLWALQTSTSALQVVVRVLLTAEQRVGRLGLDPAQQNRPRKVKNSPKICFKT
jgi:hypothetical protein